jgi:hypothetical protein
MSIKEIERAEKAEKDRAEKDRKEKDKSDRKIQNKVEQDKVRKDRSDREFQVSERARKFREVLGMATEKSKGCCEPCNYQVRTSNGEYQPCKMGHKDSGPNKEICADCSSPRCRPKEVK